MVEKEIIRNSLEEAVSKWDKPKHIIYKCNYGKILGKCTFPPMLMSSLNKFYEIKHENDKEEAFVLNEKGEIINTYKGNEDHVIVFVDDEQINQIKEGHKLHITHNHPTQDTDDTTFKKYSNCLSKEDMMSLLNTINIDGGDVLRAESITAESPYGARMTLYNKNPLQYENYGKYEKAVQNLLKSNKEFDRIYFKMSTDYYEENIQNIKLTEVILPDGSSETRYEEPSYSNMLKRLHKYQYNYVKNNYYNFIKENIGEFEDLDCELSVRFL
jgi:hypothetical protein